MIREENCHFGRKRDFKRQNEAESPLISPYNIDFRNQRPEIDQIHPMLWISPSGDETTFLRLVYYFKALAQTYGQVFKNQLLRREQAHGFHRKNASMKTYVIKTFLVFHIVKIADCPWWKS